MIKLCEKEECTGCGACYNACPKGCLSMAPDKEGFLHPKIDVDKCVQCHSCERSCPVLNPIDKNEPINTYASWALDDKVRTTSSSGGMFYIIASEIIHQGGVVYGVIMNEEGHTYHTYAKNLEELNAMKGSKYVQSDTKLVFKEIKKYLKDGSKVLFTGTPCQIAGLKKYLQNIPQELLFTVDLVCHGVPSPQSLVSYIEKLKNKHKNINVKSLQFRNLNKWEYSPSIIYNNKRHRLICSENVYLYCFLKGYLMRPNCYSCQYAGVERVGDISIADFWNIGQDDPFEQDTNKGCSLLMINTNKGRSLFERFKDNIFFQERKLSEAVKYNTQLRHPFVKPAKRDGFYEYFYSHSLYEIYKYIIPLKSRIGVIVRLFLRK